MKIVTVTLTHAGKVVKVAEAGANALAAIDTMVQAGYDLNTAVSIDIKTAQEPKEYT